MPADPPVPISSRGHRVVDHFEDAIPLPHPGGHPLGKRAEKNVDYKTNEVRKVLVDNLRRYFSGDLTGFRECRAYGKRGPDFTVQPEGSLHPGTRVVSYPSDELVTRLEIGLALERLAFEKPRPYDTLISYVMGEHVLGVPKEKDPDKRRWLTKERIAALDGHSFRTINAWLTEALDFLIEMIWSDE